MTIQFTENEIAVTNKHENVFHRLIKMQDTIYPLSHDQT